MSDATRKGMTPGQARTLEYTIVGLAILALLLIFQPFSLPLFSVGAGLIIFAGLLFNVVPMCQPGRSFGYVARGFLIVLVIFAIVTGLALLSAWLYAQAMSPRAP